MVTLLSPQLRLVPLVLCFAVGAPKCSRTAAVNSKDFAGTLLNVESPTGGYQ